MLNWYFSDNGTCDTEWIFPYVSDLAKKITIVSDCSFLSFIGRNFNPAPVVEVLKNHQHAYVRCMILVDWQLLDRIARGYIRIDPYDKNLVQPNSLDIRLGNHFVWYEHSSEVIDPYNPESVSSLSVKCTQTRSYSTPGSLCLPRRWNVSGCPIISLPQSKANRALPVLV